MLKERARGLTPIVLASLDNDFNRDYHVSFSPEEKATAYYNYKAGGFPSPEAPGISVFSQDEASLPHTMSWVRRHDKCDT